ncbi:MAG: type II methionyl aminopeptidase, partial [Candidatus Bathyarchaeia archaeon]|nr:type II methionyl aminopeptidase [Candidatus Bathyarchaeota archaeon]
MPVGEEVFKACRIAAELRRKVGRAVHPGKPIIQLCEEIEGEIRRLGGEPAFPCNVGINEVAAHYTPGVNDTSRIPINGVVKIDFGIHINGYIADTAFTIALSPEYHPLVKAVEDALEAAVESLRPGVKAGEVGAAIERTIKGWGYKPIRNLMGHKMERFILHAGKSIPNVSDLDGTQILEGELYAVEPFLTTLNGGGSVVELNRGLIYRLHKEKGIKDRYAKELVKRIRDRFYTLPFTVRWLRDEMDNPSFAPTFKQLLDRGNIKVYPILVEKRGEPVAQAEHTILITHDGCKILTKT